MIYVSGDCHVPHNVKKLNTKNWPEQKELNKNDYLIIVGDFGLYWTMDKEHKWWIEWFKTRNYTILWVDGNHENFDMIKEFPIINKFGGKVTKCADNIFHLRRGEIYEIDDHKIFTFGGAESTDKEQRVMGVSWWPEEVSNYSEINYALDNLAKHDYKVDYILTHTSSSRVVSIIADELHHYRERIRDSTSLFLQEVENLTTYKKWYFGHFHDDINIDEKNVLLFNKIIKLGDSV